MRDAISSIFNYIFVTISQKCPYIEYVDAVPRDFAEVQYVDGFLLRIAELNGQFVADLVGVDEPSATSVSYDMAKGLALMLIESLQGNKQFHEFFEMDWDGDYATNWFGCV